MNGKPATNDDEINVPEFFSIAKLVRKYEMKLWIIPLICSITLFVILTISYLIVSYTNSFPLFWLVSDVGASRPVAGYFSQSLDIIALTFLLANYFRCKQIDYHITKFKNEYKNNNDHNKMKLILYLSKMNSFAFYTSLICSVGFMIIGDFNSVEHVHMHGLGVISLYTTIAYTYSQKAIAQKLYEHNELESRPISLTIIYYILLIGWPTATVLFFSSLMFLPTPSIYPWYDHEFRMNWSRLSPVNNQSRFSSSDLFCLGVEIEWFIMYIYCLLLLSVSNRMRLFKNWNKVKID